MKPHKWAVGIDYSMTCPCITIADSELPFSFTTCKIWYLTDRVPVDTFPNIVGTRFHNDCASNEERFAKISQWAVDIIGTYVSASIYIEDYSYGSKGKVFHIAENTGVLKYRLYELGFAVNPVPPTVIKKFAFTNGNATKDQMNEAFMKETGVKLMPVFQPKAESVGSPVGDIVDSFYICKYGYVTDALELNTAKG